MSQRPGRMTRPAPGCGERSGHQPYGRGRVRDNRLRAEEKLSVEVVKMMSRRVMEDFKRTGTQEREMSGEVCVLG
jgi:hypothetical protein